MGIKLEKTLFIILFLALAGIAKSAEKAPDGESKAIAGLKDIFIKRQKELWVSKGKKALRGAHALGFGCLKANFKVLSNIPKDLKVGLFSKEKNYKAWVRFSSASSTPKADSEGDSRGMAIKVMGVEGKKVLKEEEDALTHDFLTVSHPIFVVKNAVQFERLMKVVQEHGSPVWYFIPSVYKPWTWELTQFNIARAVLGRKIPHVFDVQYFSMVPYRLGNKNQVKYSNRPCKGNTPSYSTVPEKGPFYKRRMKEHLSKKSICYDFMVQVKKKGMLIEDATQLWNESDSPFIPVAKIEISKQKFDTPKQQEYCENLSFNPWHALPEHRPLGSLNRARRVIYQAVSKFRHENNKAKREEPTDYVTF